MPDPPLFAAASLTALLRHSGIPVSGGARVGTTPSTARLAYVERSAPLAAIIAFMNKSSDNFFAEMLTKGLGASFGGAGSTAAGVRVERAFLLSQGIRPATFAVTDGSGLSYADRETSLDITDLLKDMALRSDWPVFWSSLSVAGVDGTLADRMRGTTGPARRACQDRHPDRGELPVGLRQGRQRHVARLLDTHERGPDRRGRGACRSGCHRGRARPLTTGRRRRVDAEPVAESGPGRAAERGGRRRLTERPAQSRRSMTVVRLPLLQSKLSGMGGEADRRASRHRADAAIVNLAGELAADLTRLRRVLRRATRRSLPYEPLPRNQVDLLHLAADRPGISVASAAGALGLAPNTVSTLVNEVCRAGLLARDRDAADRRVARLSLTAAGAARLAAWRDRRAEVLSAALAGLAEADRAALSAGLPALERLIARLERHEGGTR